ncbi:MAG TPA: hypothetical protein VGO46_09540 [Gemmatimonadaceae bacterium]|jgi:hypothetical protein|nr:hypothetical protein [Gemmatimonadaceae bacterium]
MTTEVQRRALHADIRSAFVGSIRPAKDAIALHQGEEWYTIYSLSPGFGGKAAIEDWAVEILQPLTDKQAAVIDRFLELAERDDDLGPQIEDIAERREHFRELRARCNASE